MKKGRCLMFYKKNTDGYQFPLEGVAQKTLVYGEKTFKLKHEVVNAGFGIIFF
jgi:hypothetical protein